MLPQPEAVFRIMSLPLAISGDVAGPRESHSLRARRALIAARLGQDELNHSKSWPCGHKSAARVSIGDQLGHVAAAKWRAMGHEETSIVRLNVMQLSSMGPQYRPSGYRWNIACESDGANDAN
jgi:hypothetical protein